MAHGANRQNAFQLAMLLLPTFVQQAELAYPEPKSGPLKNVYVRTALSTVLQMVGAAAALNNPAFGDTIATIINSTVAYNNEAARVATAAPLPFPSAPQPPVSSPAPDTVETDIPVPAIAPSPFVATPPPAIAPSVPNVMTQTTTGS